MNDNKLINKNLHPFGKSIQIFLTLTLMATLLTACMQTTGTSIPAATEPSYPPPVEMGTDVPSYPPPAEGGTRMPDDSGPAIVAATGALAKQLGISADSVQLIFAQSIQWPDSCLGVTPSGVMCAMHVVDGYRIQLSADNMTYEMHTNLDGSQIVRVPGIIPTPVGLSFTIGSGAQCQTFLIKENQDVLHGSCDKPMDTTPFIEAFRNSELEYYITNYNSFALNTPNGFVNFIAKGDIDPTPSQQRSIAAWADMVANEITAGRSSASNGLVIGWHREGGLAGFCDDVIIYASGSATATTCKSGRAEEVGQIWLSGEQLDQLYEWVDNFARFEYNPKTNATADAMTIELIFEGQSKNSASQEDQEAIASFAQSIYTQAK